MAPCVSCCIFACAGTKYYWSVQGDSLAFKLMGLIFQPVNVSSALNLANTLLLTGKQLPNATCMALQQARLLCRAASVQLRDNH